MAQVRLDPKIDTYIDELVERGEASSKEDYVNAVLRERLDMDMQEAAEFWAEVDKGREDIAAGRYTSVEEAFEIVRREIATVRPPSK
jgi:Arc/MetJ-type ribon-helix-helix transcriptional regulator